MTCAEARRLLDAGVVPGSTRGRDPLLGFHLATCAACRAYRERRAGKAAPPVFAALPASPAIPLPTMSAAPPPVAAPALPTPQPPPAAAPPVQPRRAPSGTGQGRAWWPWLLAGLLLALIGSAGWYVGLPLLRAYRHIRAMHVGTPSVAPIAMVLPTATPTPVRTPPPAPTLRPTRTPLPTATIRPSATPWPTATAMPSPTPTPLLPAARPMTVLLIGLDARPGEGLLARGDALMLARLDPDRGAVTLLSLPRDLWVPIPGYGEGKINGAFLYGEQREPQGGGLRLMRQTVGAALGVEVDYAVAVDFRGFRALIDAIGGITVDVPRELYDPAFPTEDYGYTVAHFLPGPQQMDGATALMYARTRHPDSDFERIKRQQQVIVAIAERLRERGVLRNLHEADALTTALLPYVHTDLPPDLALAMLWAMRDVERGAVTRLVVTPDMLWETTVRGAYALVPQPGVLTALGQRLLATP